MKIHYILVVCIYQNLIGTRANLQSVSAWGLNLGLNLGTFMGLLGNIFVCCMQWRAEDGFKCRKSWSNSGSALLLTVRGH